MHESPEVAILQHGSGVMQVVHNMFENGSEYQTWPPLADSDKPQSLTSPTSSTPP